MPDDNPTWAETKVKLEDIAKLLGKIESQVSAEVGAEIKKIKIRVLKVAQEDPGTRNIGPGGGRRGGSR